MTQQTDTQPTIEPTRSRPQMPDVYGVPENDEGLLDWSWAVERLTTAKNYWFTTTRPDGRPHAMPAWAAWTDGALYFDGSPETRRARNLAQNSSIVIHLESGDEVVIVEGEAVYIPKVDPEVAKRLAAALGAKYSPIYVPEPDTWNEGGLWRLKPVTAFAWTEFPKNVTRWRWPRS
jgi:hypothetical protein